MSASPFTVANIAARFPAGKITPHACSTTGIAEPISEKNVSIYPSPAINNITIDIENGINITSLKVFNVLGKNVINQIVDKSDKYELNISKLENGLYFVEINTENGIVTKKFMKN